MRERATRPDVSRETPGNEKALPSGSASACKWWSEGDLNPPTPQHTSACKLLGGGLSLPVKVRSTRCIVRHTEFPGNSPSCARTRNVCLKQKRLRECCHQRVGSANEWSMTALFSMSTKIIIPTRPIAISRRKFDPAALALAKLANASKPKCAADSFVCTLKMKDAK